MKVSVDNKSLLAQWKAKHTRAEQTKGPAKVPPGARIPLSYGQQRIWLLQHLYPENSFYNYTESFGLYGTPDAELLQRSLQRLTDCHGILRTTFHIHEGEIIQRTEPHVKVDLKFHDLSDLTGEAKAIEKQRLLMDSANTVFPMNLEPPVRYSLIKLDESEFELLITMHHILTDAWSMELYREQLCAIYSGAEAGKVVFAPNNDLGYADFAYWERSLPIDNSQLHYWKQKLAGEIPVLNLPADYAKPARPSFRGAQNRLGYAPAFSSAILDLSKALKITPYTLFLSVFYVLLYRYTRQEDILIGSPVSKRNANSLEKMLGFFSETLVLRAEVKPELTFREFTTRVRDTTLEAFSNMAIPFDMLVRELQLKRSLASNPLFQVMFLYHSQTGNNNLGQAVTVVSDYPDTGVSKFDLTLFVFEKGGILTTMFEYATDLFDVTTIARMQRHMKLLLEQIIREPGSAIGKIPMISGEETDFFHGINRMPLHPLARYKAIHQPIEEMSVLYPGRKALVAGRESVTYKEMDRLGNKVAAAILAYTRGEKPVVGLCANRTVNQFIGMLGILKAGCAYLPLDPEAPHSRNEFMIADSGAALLLIAADVSGKSGYLNHELLCLDDILADEAASDYPLPEAVEDRLAYIIYTSGSTGRPKGVPITHRSLLASTGGRLQFYPDNPAAFLLMSALAFDSSKAGIFWTLCTGGTLVIAGKHEEQDISGIESLIVENGVTHTLMLPSLYHVLLRYANPENLGSLQIVIVAGEACFPSLCRMHREKLPWAGIYNEYGPTEATVWCIARRLSADDAEGPVSIGRPVAQAEVYLLDHDHKLVPHGAIGEIYIGGPGLAGRYIHRPELDHTAYIPNPFDPGGNTKLYKTGDLARFNKEGNLIFLGRADQQLKVSGFRIEPGEIETTIGEHPMVNRVVVQVREQSVEQEAVIPENASAGDLLNLLGNHIREAELVDILDSVESMSDTECQLLLKHMESPDFQNPFPDK